MALKSRPDFLGDKNTLLEVLLDDICRQLQLNKTRREAAENAYDAVSKIIEADTDFFGPLDPLIYAYGSMGIGTTVKPLSREEYDLDWTVVVKFDKSKIGVQEFLDKLFDLLNNNGTYKGKVKRLRFCVRIEYANEFHMDIMPGCEIPERLEKMEVPDTKKVIWAIRNPKGYIRWFQGLFITDIEKLSLYDYYRWRGNLQVRAEVEPLPEAQHYEITQPIQRAVQLLKRYRDIYFQNDTKDLATSSVILTTIAGLFYQQETTIYDTLDGIIQRVYAMSQTTTGIEVINPADFNENENNREKFSDKWNERPELYDAFIEFISSLRIHWQQLKDGNGMLDAKLKFLFGEGVTQEAYKNQARMVNTERLNKNLNIDPATGLITTQTTIKDQTRNTVPIPKNTNHGDPEE